MLHSNTKPHKEIVPLTSVRGFAAIAVIAMHFSATMQGISTGSFPSLAPHGGTAVDVFFVLSGFIMAYTYLPSFSPRISWNAYWNFLLKRFARILPLNVFVTTAVIFSAVVTYLLFGENLFPRVDTGHLGSAFFTNALMLSGLGFGQSINWPAWSISVEFVAYLLFPLLVLGVFQTGHRCFIGTAITAFAVLFLVCATGSHFSPDGFHNHPMPWRDLARCLSEFVLGLVVFRIYASRRCEIFRSDSVALSIIVLILASVLLNSPELLTVLLFPPLILALSLNDGVVARLFSLPFPRFLGKISFSLYLVHDNFRAPAVWLVHAFHPGPVIPVVGLLLAAAFTFLMILPAWGCFVWIEGPGRLWFQRLGRRKMLSKAPRSYTVAAASGVPSIMHPEVTQHHKSR